MDFFHLYYLPNSHLSAVSSPDPGTPSGSVAGECTQGVPVQALWQAACPTGYGLSKQALHQLDADERVQPAQGPIGPW